MKVKAKKSGGLAIDCRTNVYFKQDDILGIGSGSTKSSSGLSEEDLKELVRLGLAEETKVEETKVEEAKVEEPEVEEPEVEEPEYMSFTKKSDLEAYAKDKYDIDLDKRTSLKGMIEQLESALGGDL